jgi:hypothetical protein
MREGRIKSKAEMRSVAMTRSLSSSSNTFRTFPFLKRVNSGIRMSENACFMCHQGLWDFGSVLILMKAKNIFNTPVTAATVFEQGLTRPLDKFKKWGQSYTFNIFAYR